MTVRVYDPRGSRRPAKAETAPRPAALSGETIGLLDNSKEQADVMLERIASKLDGQGARIARARKGSFSRVAEPDVLDQLRECGAVVTALGG
ncbi:MAG TPA: hypothetical protein VNJ51_06820 [Candidatus Dormibacteraeota bacterium]|nr:hypothetical protein [Candidatus Dormibacteraeota bacterium]